MSERKYHLETLAIHAGQEIEPTTRARGADLIRRSIELEHMDNIIGTLDDVFKLA